MDKKANIRFDIIAVICIIIFCAAISPISLQNDTFYTIKIGEHILNNGIDMTDPFSIHDLPYTYPHWLYDVCIYLIYSMGGMVGIYISTIVLSIILGISIYYTNKKISKNSLISFLLTLGVMCVLKSFVAARAQLVTFILFTLTIYFIEKFIETKKKRYGIGLIIIPIIIANIHSAVWPFYFILFLPYIAEYIIASLDSDIVFKVIIRFRENKIKKLSKITGNEEKIAKLEIKNQKQKERLNKYKESKEKREKNAYKIKIEKNDAIKWLILIFVICLFTGLLTPLGDTPYTYLVKTMQGNTTQNISEHLPMVLAQNNYAMAIILIVLIILIFTDTKIRLRDLFMLGGLILLALISRRQLSMLALIGVYSINKLICEFINKYDPTGTEKMVKIITGILGAIITVLLTILVSIIVFKPQVNNKFINTRAYPVEAANWINENLNVNEIRLYNEYNYGSYLLYQNIPVFIDSRADLYAPEFSGDKEKDIFTDFINTASASVYYEDIFEKYGITHLLIPNNAKINLFISRDDNYLEIYKDDNFVIYERLSN